MPFSRSLQISAPLLRREARTVWAASSVKIAVSFVTGGVVIAALLLEPLPIDRRQATDSRGAASICAGTLVGLLPASVQALIGAAGGSSTTIPVSVVLGSILESSSTIVTRPARSSARNSSFLAPPPNRGRLLHEVTARRAATAVTATALRENFIVRSPRALRQAFQPLPARAFPLRFQGPAAAPPARSRPAEPHRPVHWHQTSAR